MLIDTSRCEGRFPLQRLVLSGLLASLIMTVLLYVSISYSQRKYVGEFQIEIYKYTESLHNNFKELTEDEMDEVEDEMMKRKQHVKDYCDLLFMHHDGYVNAQEFFINENHHLIWCNVFKAASTSWMYNFNLLAGYNESEAAMTKPYQELARKLYPRPTVEQLRGAKNNSMAMIIVRHPFERLSSAYRDKIQNSLTGPYADLAEKILKKYRKKRKNNSDSNYNLPSLWPTFEEFVRFILDEVKKGRALDIHWTPISPFCTPCQFEFDVIIKFETIDKDQRYLIQKAGLQDIIRPQWKNPGDSKIENNGINTTELMKEHYSQITTDQMSKLYWMYRQDFLIFDYTPSFFNLTRDYEEKKEDINYEPELTDSDFEESNEYYEIVTNEPENTTKT